jgi:hypothetical protein
MLEHVDRSVPIAYEQVEQAYRKVRRGGKAAGIDSESWSEFDKKLEDNLYVIRNIQSVLSVKSVSSVFYSTLT